MLIFGRLSTMTDCRNPLIFRCAVPDDELFLFELYGSVRKEEMAAWGWDPAQEQMFLKLQFMAQRRHYDIAFPNADHKIILSDNRPIGRILVYRTEREIRLVDIALLPEYRGNGIGASLVRGLFEEAMTANKPVTLHVGKLSRAVRLYQRLGFSIIGDTGTDHKMEWRPGEGSTERRLPI
jgi:ribosomal protein S18 acetylase RimI-like enzyme